MPGLRGNDKNYGVGKHPFGIIHAIQFQRINLPMLAAKLEESMAIK